MRENFMPAAVPLGVAGRSLKETQRSNKRSFLSPPAMPLAGRRHGILCLEPAGCTRYCIALPAPCGGVVRNSSFRWTTPGRLWSRRSGPVEPVRAG